MRSIKLAAFIFFVSCSAGEENATPAPQMPNEATHQLENIFTLSEIEDGSYIQYVSQLSFLSNGNLIFPASGRLVEINSTGEMEQWIGRSGRGPGEYNSISSFAVTPGDTVHLYDRGNARQVIFAKDLSGNWGMVRSEVVRFETGRKFPYLFPHEVYPLGQDTYMGLFENVVALRDTTTRVHQFMAPVDHNLRTRGEPELIKPTKYSAIYRSERSVSTQFSRNFKQAFYRYKPETGRIIYVENNSNRIVQIDSGGTHSITGYLPFEEVPLDFAPIDQSLNRLQSSGYEQARVNLIRSKYLKHHAYYKNVLLDGDRLWVHVTRKDTTAPDWLVTDLSGKIVAVFKGPENFTSLATNDQKLYGLHYEDEIPYLKSFEITGVD